VLLTTPFVPTTITRSSIALEPRSITKGGFSFDFCFLEAFSQDGRPARLPAYPARRLYWTYPLPGGADCMHDSFVEMLTGVCLQLDLRELVRLAQACKRFR
jgi:hypothetical protein